jgi:hypothetical protein
MKMKNLILTAIAAVGLSMITSAQIKTFMNSSEFKEITQKISGLDYNNLNGIWTESINESSAMGEITTNTYQWGDDETDHKLFLHKNYIIFTYHLSVGSNTGTLIYNRKTHEYKAYPFNSSELSENNLTITREGFKNGHWWQNGIFKLNTNQIIWGNNIER